jgi:hypothetical protein
VVPIDEDTVPVEPQAKPTVWSDAEDLLENFSDEQVIEALRRLPEDQRLTLFLTDVEHLNQQEVAEITGVPVGTVKSRTSRAAMSSEYLLSVREMVGANHESFDGNNSRTFCRAVPRGPSTWTGARSAGIGWARNVPWPAA